MDHYTMKTLAVLRSNSEKKKCMDKLKIEKTHETAIRPYVIFLILGYLGDPIFVLNII